MHPQIPRWLILSLLFISSASAAVGADIGDLDITVSVDRGAYPPGATVTAEAEQCNNTDEVISQEYGCPRCHDFFQVIASDGSVAAECSLGGILVVVTKTWQPGECKIADCHWDQTALDGVPQSQVPDGTYQFRHELFFNSINFSKVTLGEPFQITSAPVAIPSLSATGLRWLALAIAVVGVMRLRLPSN